MSWGDREHARDVELCGLDAVMAKYYGQCALCEGMGV